MLDAAATGRLGKRERVARVVGSAAATRLLRQVFRTPGIVCITHHRVTERVEHDPDIISASSRQLEDQAGWVKRTFLTLSGTEISDIVAGRLPLKEPAVTFTFDDAYEDNFAAGRMLMDGFGIAATFFVATGFIETGVVPPWDRLGYAAQHARATGIRIPQLPGHGPWEIDLRNYGHAITELMRIYSILPVDLKPTFVSACETAAGASVDASPRPSPFMTWDQIRALRDMGHCIGAHTHTHPVLASLPPEEQAHEIALSKRVIEEQLERPVETFAYPYGKPERSFSAVTKRLVEAAGFRTAFSFYGGWNRPDGMDAYDVRRIKVDPGTSMPMFRARVTTRGTVPV
jgi:peptidoglycan/xylan/chitin deacetylase (PgdA/CDA1 family)